MTAHFPPSLLPSSQIVSWVLAVSINASSPTPFMWNGQDYLMKMYTDLNFVQKTIGANATKIANFCEGNPLLLSRDEIAGKGVKNQVGRAHAASIVILDVVRRSRAAAGGMRMKKPVAPSKSPKKKTKLRVEAVMVDKAEEEEKEKEKETVEIEEEATGVGQNIKPEEEAGLADDPKAKPEKETEAEKEAEAEVEELEEEEEVDEESYGDDDYDDFEETAEDKNEDEEPEASPKHTPPKSVNQQNEADERITLEKEPPFLSSPISDDMLKQFDMGKLLGEGAYGFVYLAIHKATSKKVAIKKFKNADEEDEDVDYVVKTQEREVAICNQLKHKRIVEVTENFVQDGTQYIVFEMMQCNVLELIERNADGIKSPEVVQVLMRQLLEGLAFCHEQNIIHRDIKPENLLLNDVDGKAPVLKLCDFGAARNLDEVGGRRGGGGGLTHYVGSRWYRAPELLGNSTDYGLSVDAWSAACIMAELITGNALFQGDDEKEVVQYIFDIIDPPTMPILRAMQQRELINDVYAASRGQKKKTLKEEVGKGLNLAGHALLEDMLTIDPAARSAAKVCVGHKYFLESPDIIEENKEEEEEEEEEDYGDEDYEEDDGFEQEEEEEKKEEKEEKKEEESGLTEASECFDFGTRELQRALKSAVLEGEVDALGDGLGDTRVSEVETFVREAAGLGTEDQITNLVMAIQKSIDRACGSRVKSCKDWMLAQQRSDISLAEVVSAVEEDVGRQKGNWRNSNEAALAGLEALRREGAGATKRQMFWNESINSVLSLVSAFLLDAEVSQEVKLNGIRNLEKLLGLPKLTDNTGILSPTNKGLFLYMKITSGGVSRLTLTTYRDNCLSTCRNLLEHAGYFENDIDDRSFVICPYYRSEFGKKISEGHNVEEGEGLGPRKELFILMSHKFLQKYRSIDVVLKGCSGEKGDNVISYGGSSYALGDVKVGGLVVVNEGEEGEQRRVVTRVNKSRGQIMLDKMLVDGFREASVAVMESCTPKLVWKQDCEKVWINTQIVDATENRVMFQLLGMLMGLTVVNQCLLDFSMPTIFFKLLLDEGYEVKKEDLAGFDDGMLKNLEMVEKHWGADQIKEVCDVEGVRVGRGAGKEELYTAYEKHLLSSSLVEGVKWQMEAVRSGFFSMVKREELREAGVGGEDLGEIVCGVDWGKDFDFDFRDIFQVVCDDEVR